MRANRKEPEIILRDGKPRAVIIDIDEYQEMLERLEDTEDLRVLEEMRKSPLQFKRLEDFLDEYSPSVCGLLRASGRTRLKRLSARNFQRIIPRVRALAENPRPIGCESSLAQETTGVLRLEIIGLSTRLTMKEKLLGLCV